MERSHSSLLSCSYSEGYNKGTLGTHSVPPFPITANATLMCVHSLTRSLKCHFMWKWQVNSIWHQLLLPPLPEMSAGLFWGFALMCFTDASALFLYFHVMTWCFMLAVFLGLGGLGFVWFNAVFHCFRLSCVELCCTVWCHTVWCHLAFGCVAFLTLFFCALISGRRLTGQQLPIQR